MYCEPCNNDKVHAPKRFYGLYFTTVCHNSTALSLCQNNPYRVEKIGGGKMMQFLVGHGNLNP